MNQQLLPVSEAIRRAQFPPKLRLLFEPKFLKIMYGGRGAGRSWGCARALLIKSLDRPLRVLCARELQKSIDESVYQLLKDQIELLGLQEFFVIQRDKIFGINGSIFIFEGIKNNINAIRSFEGIDICWVEEANKVSKNSWEVLLPTIRREGAEVWITFNPEDEEDYTFKTFVKSADADMSLVSFMTYEDNPWFPEVSRKQMEKMKRDDFDAYLNVWLGQPRRNLEGVVYAKELRRAAEEGRICKVQWERAIPVDVFMDLGRRDHTSIWLAQRVAMQRRVLEAYQNTGYDISFYIKWLQRQQYTYGTIYLPHDGKSLMIGSKLSVEQTMRSAGFRVRVMPRVGIAEGINATRLMFDGLYFDEAKCDSGLYSLRRYKYDVVEGKLSNEPLHDEHSDFADGLRTMAIAMRPRKRDKELQPQSVSERVKEAMENAEEFFGARSKHRSSVTAGSNDWMES